MSNQTLRQELVQLSQELPDEVLPEAIALLRSLSQPQNPPHGNPQPSGKEADFETAMRCYREGSEKYKNALRRLAQ